MKRLLLALLAVLIVAPAAIIAFQTLHEAGRSHAGTPPLNQAEQVRRGEYLATAGNCMACHTVSGGKKFAGGRAIETPFGSIYTSNITPDPATGIGNWSADDLWRAIHNGKSKDGSFLYPAFPYPSYTKVTRTDSDAIHAYLMSQPAVRQATPANRLAFPYNQRVLLAFWRTLYFQPGEYQAEPDRSAQWNRGAYLVQGLGHCAACHSGRNLLGGTIAGPQLGGAAIAGQDWHAASLSADRETGLGDWSTEEIAQLLQSGVSARGAVSGPMAEVVAGSLQHLSGADTLAMATYLKTIPPSRPPAVAGTAYAPPDAGAILQQGASIYRQQCAACHMADGAGQPPAYPPLAGNRALAAGLPVNAVRIVLNGGYPPSTGGNPRPYGMPPFGHSLDDSEIAAVLSYVRTSWGNQGEMVAPLAVARLRGVPAK